MLRLVCVVAFLVVSLLALQSHAGTTATVLSAVQQLAGYGGSMEIANGTMYFVTDDANTMTTPPLLFRCNADGTGCVWASAAGNYTGTRICDQASLAVDLLVTKSVFIACRNQHFGYRCSLFRSYLQHSPCSPSPHALTHCADPTRSPGCNLDGTGCKFVNASRGARAFSCYTPDLLIDQQNERLLIASEDSGVNDVLLTRCALTDTTGATCVYSSPDGAGSSDGKEPRLLIDSTSSPSRLIAVYRTDDAAKIAFASVCDIAGTTCGRVSLDVAAGMPTAVQTCSKIAASIDTVNRQLLVSCLSNMYLAQVPDPQYFGTLRLYRCPLTLTSCIVYNVSNVNGAAGVDIYSVVDNDNGNLLITMPSQTYRAILYICSLLGTSQASCVFEDVSGGLGVNSAAYSVHPFYRFGVLSMVACNLAVNSKPTIYRRTTCPIVLSRSNVTLPPPAVLVAGRPISLTFVTRNAVGDVIRCGELVGVTNATTGAAVGFSIAPGTDSAYLLSLTDAPTVSGAYRYNVTLNGLSVASFGLTVVADVANVSRTLVLSMPTEVTLGQPMYFDVIPMDRFGNLAWTTVVSALLSDARSSVALAVQSLANGVFRVELTGSEPGVYSLALFLNGAPFSETASLVRVLLQCDAGFFVPQRTDASCIACPRNSFSNVSNAVSCTDCPTGTWTMDATQASSPEQCVCLAGFYSPSGRAAGESGGCLPCPTGGFCAGNAALPVALPGFVPATEAGTLFYECPVREVCAASVHCADRASVVMFRR